ncbi:MAG: hypothetical protein KJN77_05390 [Gammaproteobacteria bacterium]|nr:hypothetical protein [Gammaproteobacteria bacterium]
MNWDIYDFAVAGALLMAVGVAYTLAARRTGDSSYRSAIGVALAAAFSLFWVNGAVGIIGDESNDANMLYVALIGVAVIGAVIARLEPRGMSRVMVATALAQIFVPVIDLVAGLSVTASVLSWDVLVLTGFFTTFWLVSAGLFRKAARA